MIPFGRFEPDRGEMAEGICMKADGVLPLVEGYGPAPDLSVSSSATALPAACVGMISLTLSDGTWQVFAATSDELYEMQSDYTWDPLTASLNVTAGDDLSMVHFGKFLLLSDTTDGLRAYNVEAPAGFTAYSAAGKPRFIFVWGTQVVGLDCLETGGDRNNRLIRVSAFNSFTEWKTDGADYQPLEDGGALLWGCDLQGGAALILQERAVRMLQFGDAGGGAMFSQRKIADGLGSVGSRSCVNYSGMAFWLATDDFCMFTAGGGIQRIGAGRVDDWFFTEADQGHLDKVQGEIDLFRKIVWWRYKHVDVVSESVFEDMIGYSWQFDCWVTNSVTTTYLSNVATPGITLDDMDALYGEDLDAIDIPLDSRAFQGGQPVFGALNGVLKFGTFTGSAQPAILRTATTNTPVTGIIQWATPIDNAANGTLELGVKDQPGTSITWKAAASKGSAGRVPLRGRGLNIAFRYNIAAEEDWTYARGIDHVKGSQGGPK
jgi:hypothetical protein